MSLELTNWLTALSLEVMILLLTRRMGDASMVPVHHLAVDDRCEECPSSCDSDGQKREPFSCRVSSASEQRYCCDFGFILECCTNETLMISKEQATNDFYCTGFLYTYGRTVMSVCVPVGLTCFVTVVVLLIYQRRRKMRRRTNTQTERHRRRTSNASCSSQGPQPSIGSNQIQYPMDTFYSGNTNLQQSSAIVISASNLDGTSEETTRALRLMQTVNAVPMVVAPSPTDIYVIQSGGVYPPPYSDENPPTYNDLYP